ARLHAVPLVQGDHQRTTAFQHEAQQVEVMVDHAFAGIHDEHHHVRVLDRLQGFHHGELFHRFENLAAPTHARRVDQRVLFVIPFEWDVDAVAGGTRLVVDDDPVFAQHAVDQGRFADVGPPDDRQLDAVFLARARNAFGLLAFGDLFAFLTVFRLTRVLGEI